MVKAKGKLKRQAAEDARPINRRGQEWEAETLTGNRAQRGNLPNGHPRWVYEVQWKGNHPNTFEPAANLINWEQEMREVDDAYHRSSLLPRINPAVEAQRTREAVAKAKAEELLLRKQRLHELKQYRKIVAQQAEGEAGDSSLRANEMGATCRGEVVLGGVVFGEAVEPDGLTDAERALDAEALVEELLVIEKEIAILTGGAAFFNAANKNATKYSAAHCHVVLTRRRHGHW